jgi:methionyl-tRNA formyltransferase
LKLALFADKEVGFEITKYLVENFPEDLSLVMTKGSNVISALANSIGVPTYTSKSKNLNLTYPKESFDLGILAWWPDLIGQEVLDIAKHGFINTHPSLLPLNKGRYPNFWAIIEEVPFGVSIHKVKIEVDSGDILHQKEIPFDWSDNAESLYKKATEAMIALFIQKYPQIRRLELLGQSQEERLNPPRPTSEFHLMSEVKLDSQVRVRDFLNLLRAKTFSGHPGLIFEDNGVKFEVTVNIKQFEDKN